MFYVMMKKMGRWSRSGLAAIIVMLMIVLTGCGNATENQSPAFQQPNSSVSNSSPTEQPQPSPIPTNSEVGENVQAPLTSFKAVSDYIREHHTLPANFITKKEAEQLGWVPAKGNLDQVAPGKSIGGDRFGNREGLLPKAKNRIWYEADINYTKKSRGADRVLYSNDGLIYMTTDHYTSFTDITKEGSVPE